MKPKILSTGRVNQKVRTRMKILNSANELMAQATSLTLEDVAQKAGISRATIYRYYANIDLLVTEASLDIRHKSADELFEEMQDMLMEDRILHLQEHYNDLAQKHEMVFRRYLSAVLAESITSKEKLRGARRVRSLKTALDPFKSEFSEETYQNLISAASVLMGIDCFVVCKDVCDLSDQDAKRTLQWALRMMLRGIAQEKTSR
ncbi:MAG: TetR/AcrR family transcriptional regulator [Saprospiraceae bacterium]|nr:TetR/AcrR family transcriptional regulator [Saprospiraceae bacterium]